METEREQLQRPVTVRQTVRDLEVKFLIEKTVEQIFTFTDDLIGVFEISVER